MEDERLQKPPPGWLEALKRADEDVAAGRTVPWSEVRARVEAEIAAPVKTPSRRKA